MSVRRRRVALPDRPRSLTHSPARAARPACPPSPSRRAASAASPAPPGRPPRPRPPPRLLLRPRARRRTRRGPVARRRRRRRSTRGAGDDASGGAPSASSPAAAGQESIEAIEARLKGRRSKPKEGYFDSYPTKPSDEPLGLWETDPAAWDAKPGFEKLWSAWSGEPGMMYWMNRGAWFGAAALAFAWVLFRLVGPALGLYQLN